MHDEPKSALKKAILKLLPVLGERVEESSEPYLVWSRRGDGQWHGEYQERPALRRVYRAVRKQLDEAGADFGKVFFAKHPEYKGLVGFAGETMPFGPDNSNILRYAIGRLWQRHGTFDCDEVSVDAIVEEFADFVDRPTVWFRFQAQLLNYRMTCASLTFPQGLTIRRLSEQEVSRFHGGSPHTLGFLRPRFSGPHEFVIEGEHEEPKVFGGGSADGMSAAEKVTPRLDKAILCLRTFKEGHVGYDYVHFKPLKFCPLPMGSRGCGDLYVPFGSYDISEEEVVGLCEYAERIFEMSEPAMEMACRRLADAETRTRPADRVVDAVIGMEALLLAGLGKEERRGELRYRFSLHYSTLFVSAGGTDGVAGGTDGVPLLSSSVLSSEAVRGVGRPLALGRRCLARVAPLRVWGEPGEDSLAASHQPTLE